MANLNKVLLMGKLTRDPELRYTPRQTAVTDIALAINRVRNTEGGERTEETTFVDVTLWGRQAEVVHQYLKKGSGIFIEGRLQLDSWEDKASGQRRSKLKVVGENFQFIGGQSGQGGGGGGGSRPSSGQDRDGGYQAGYSHDNASSADEPDYHDQDEADEIPF